MTALFPFADRVRVVLFDAGNTLLWLDHRRLAPRPIPNPHRRQQGRPHQFTYRRKHGYPQMRTQKAKVAYS